MDATRIILVVAISILTAILTLVGYEVYLIFREFHKSMKKVNNILDNVTEVSQSVSRQINSLSELLATAKNTVELVKTFISREKTPLLTEESTKSNPTQKQSGFGDSVRRFFTRSGKKIS